MKNNYYIDSIVDICDCKHLTVDEIFYEIKEKFPNAGKSSIYRNVDILEKKWILKKVEWIGKKAYFEKNKSNHIHLIDKNSGEIKDLDLDDIDIPWLPDDFHIDSLDIKVFGNFSTKTSW